MFLSRVVAAGSGENLKLYGLGLSMGRKDISESVAEIFHLSSSLRIRRVRPWITVPLFVVNEEPNR